MTTTRYDRMRAAADSLSRYMAQEGDGYCEFADQLRADAVELEALEREMRDPYAAPTIGVLVHYADRIRGQQP